MTPEGMAAVFITFVACCVAAYILLIMQASRYEAQKADLRYLLNQAVAKRDQADPERAVLTASEEAVFGDIAERLEADMGLEIFGSDEGEAR